MESFDKFDTLLNSFDSLKRIFYNTVLESVFKLFHIQFECLIVILPFRGIDIKDIVNVRSFNFLEIFLKWLLDLVQVNDDLLTFQTTKDRNLWVFTSLSKLELTFANVSHVDTTLFKSINFSKYTCFSKGPLFLFITISSFIYNNFKVLVNWFPVFTTLDRSIQLFNTLFYISFKHIINVNVGSTSSNDFITDFLEKSTNSIIVLIILAFIPYHSNSY